MKKTSAMLLLSAGLILGSLSSCKKYEDGPAVSLLSKKTRISGEWTLESYMLNEVDKTADYLTAVGANYMLEIEKDGSYKVAGIFADNGTWVFGEDKDDVYFHSGKSGVPEQAFRITRLANKELWMKQTQSNGDVYKFKYKQ
ncbi:MAG TPA: hypothetical protein PLQ93_06210 [Bacteroidia bacterium]|nr:hypothetical protein [Bacteroidia bacterium]